MEATMNIKNVEVGLPEDIIAQTQLIKIPKINLEERIKIAFVIDLFRQGVVTLSKAAQVCNMSIYKFMNVLKERDIPAFEYDEEEYQQDKKAIAKYKERKSGE